MSQDRSRNGRGMAVMVTMSALPVIYLLSVWPVICLTIRPCQEQLWLPQAYAAPAFWLYQHSPPWWQEGWERYGHWWAHVMRLDRPW
jgi:hypothetical protein